MEVRLQFSGDPPPIPTARIYKPEEQPRKVIVLGPVLGVYLHWLGKRSTPCRGDDCPRSIHRRFCYWQGYLPIAAAGPTDRPEASPSKLLPFVLAVYDHQAQKLKDFGASPPGPILVVRRHKLKKQTVIDSILSFKSSALKLPACPDPLDTMARVWGIRRDELNGFHLEETGRPEAIDPEEFLK